MQPLRDSYCEIIFKNNYSLKAGYPCKYTYTTSQLKNKQKKKNLVSGH